MLYIALFLTPAIIKSLDIFVCRRSDQIVYLFLTKLLDRFVHQRRVIPIPFTVFKLASTNTKSQKERISTVKSDDFLFAEVSHISKRFALNDLVETGSERFVTIGRIMEAELAKLGSIVFCEVIQSLEDRCSESVFRMDGFHELPKPITTVLVERPIKPPGVEARI